jgi:hypothetical protein
VKLFRIILPLITIFCCYIFSYFKIYCLWGTKGLRESHPEALSLDPGRDCRGASAIFYLTNGRIAYKTRRMKNKAGVGFIFIGPSVLDDLATFQRRGYEFLRSLLVLIKLRVHGRMAGR